MHLFILDPDNDSLLHLSEDGHKHTIPQLPVVPVSLLIMLLSVHMNDPAYILLPSKDIFFFLLKVEFLLIFDFSGIFQFFP